METPKILAAALALDRFTARELAAHSGANLNTVRALIQRRGELFERVAGPGRWVGPGRPPSEYTLSDPAAARSELGYPNAAAGLARVADPEEDPKEEGQLLLQSADQLLARAREAPTPVQASLLAELAVEEADRALALPADEVETQRREARAATIKAFAELILAPDDDPRGALGRVAEAMAGALAVVSDLFVPTEGLRVLLEAAENREQGPPIAVVTMNYDALVEDALLGCGAGEWIRREIEDSHASLWSPPWMEPLMEARLVAGVVVHLHGSEPDHEVDATLEALETWHLPVLVETKTISETLTWRVAAHGASLLPASDPELAFGWFARALDHYRREPQTLFATHQEAHNPAGDAAALAAHTGLFSISS